MRHMHRPLALLISEVKERTSSVKAISLFLDFDGTLVPITSDPAAPRLDPGSMETLRQLAGRELLTTTIMSGRSVEDLYARVRLEGLIYAGNHGLEIFGRTLRFVEPEAWAWREQLEQLCTGLAEDLRSIAGALVEYKGLTASVHYRHAEEEDVAQILSKVYAAMARNGGHFRVNRGRKAFEIVPRTDWHKGTAVRWINSQIGVKETLSIYLGDDTSDEDAFSALPDAITIKVGPAAVTCAKYQLPGPAVVHEFLLWLAIQ